MTETSTAVGTTAAPSHQAHDQDRKWLALAVIAVAQLMVVLDASIVNIALPHAKADLGISTANQQWVVTAYTLTFGGLLLLGGRFSDFLGRKRMFIIGLIGFAAASALGGAAQSGEMLFAARALQGAFGAVLAPASLSLITVTFVEPHERARAFGVYGAIAGGGAAIGLIAGGVLTQYASWRWCLLVNVPIAVLTALAAQPLLKESKADGDRHYDIPGAVLVTGGLVSLVYGFTKASEDSWSSSTTITYLVIAAVLLVGFVFWETITAHPLLPLRVVLDRNRGGSYLISLLVGSALFAMFLFLTFYFQSVLGYSALKSGFAFLPFSAGIIFAAGVASQVMPKTGPKTPMTIGMVLSIGGLLYLTRITPDSSWLTHILPSELLLSIGLGLVFVPLASTALVGVANHDAGVASALVNTTQQVGGSLGTALLNTVSATALTSYLVHRHATATIPPDAITKAAMTHSYTVAFWWGFVMMAIALAILLVLIRAGKDDVPTGDAAFAAV